MIHPLTTCGENLEQYIDKIMHRLYADGFHHGNQALPLAVSTVSILLLYSATYSSVPRIGYRANYYNLGNAYRDLGQPEKALACYDESVRISRTFYHGYFNKGKLLVQLGRSDEAKRVLKKALKLAQANQDTLNIKRIQRQLQALGD